MTGKKPKKIVCVIHEWPWSDDVEPTEQELRYEDETAKKRKKK